MCGTLTVSLVAGATPSNSVLPALAGTPTVGQTLTLTPGTWAPSGATPVTLTDVWQSCAGSDGTTGCVERHAGGTNYMIPVSDQDLGRYIVVAETGDDGTPPALTMLSNVVGPITGTPPSAAAGVVTITGTATVGQTLTANPNFPAWDGFPKPMSASDYLWQRDGTPISGATDPTYPLVAADAGHNVRVVVTAGNGFGSPGTGTSNAVSVAGIPPTPGTPSLAGTAKVGQTLTANTNPGDWGGTPAVNSWSFQFFRCNTDNTGCVSAQGPSAIGTPTTATYILVAADVGKAIKVAVTGSNGFGTASATSALYPASGAVAGPPVNTGANGTVLPAAPVGQLLRGQTLTAASGFWLGYPEPGLTHQWQRCDGSGDVGTCLNVSPDPPVGVGQSNVGATSQSTSTYVLGDADLGKRMRVLVKATNSEGSPAAVASPLTGVVNGAPLLSRKADGSFVEPPSVSGSAVVGQTLVGSAGQWSAFPVPAAAAFFGYQWFRCSSAATPTSGCSVIGGATSATFTLTAAEGLFFIKLRVTAANGVLPDGVAESAGVGPVSTGSGGGAGGSGGPGVDLTLTSSTVVSGSSVAFTLTVRNIGTVGASGVVVSVSLPASLSLSPVPAGCSGGASVTCQVGAVAAGGSAALSLPLNASAAGIFVVQASVSSSQTDVNPSNNSVARQIFIAVGSGAAVEARTVGSTQPVGQTVVRSGKTATVALSFKLTNPATVTMKVILVGSSKVSSKLRSAVAKALGAQRKAKKQLADTQTAANAMRATAGSGNALPESVRKRLKDANHTMSEANLSLARARKAAQPIPTTVPLLTGTQLGPIGATKTTQALVYKAQKAGKVNINLVLAASTIVNGKKYAARLNAKNARGRITSIDIRFTG